MTITCHTFTTSSIALASMYNLLMASVIFVFKAYLLQPPWDSVICLGTPGPPKRIFPRTLTKMFECQVQAAEGLSVGSGEVLGDVGWELEGPGRGQQWQKDHWGEAWGIS